MLAHRWMIGFAALGSLFLGLPGNTGVAPRSARAADQTPRLKFELYQDASKDYRWRLKAGNGEELATPGQGYKAKADAQNSIDRIKKDAATDKIKFEVYEDNAKQSRWRLKASNGQVIATSSSGYKSKADAEHAIDLIKKGAASAEVVEVQEKT